MLQMETMIGRRIRSSIQSQEMSELENQEELFNTDCLFKHLTREIRKRCQLDRRNSYDIIRPNGELMQLWVRPSKEYANTCLKDRDVFILVKLENETPDSKRRNSDIPIKWKPLLNTVKGFPDLAELVEQSESLSLSQDMASGRRRSKHGNVSDPRPSVQPDQKKTGGQTPKGKQVGQTSKVKA